MKNLQFLRHKDIDERKWDETITQAANSLPYAYSWYLDCVAENWDGLVLGDYDVVMPLVWLRKLGIKCLYQPYYCQQLGVFGSDLSKEVQTAFLDYATKKFAYININLNPASNVIESDFHLKSKTNLLLDLNKGYSQLQKKYNENTKRNIQKAAKNSFAFAALDLKVFQEFYLQNVDRKKENFKTKHEVLFRRLTETLFCKELGQISAVRDSNGAPQAASFLVTHRNQLINVINTSSLEGKRMGASHFLFDQVIQRHSGLDKILDFEGSSIAGIARFYTGFGAQPTTFYNYRKTLIA